MKMIKLTAGGTDGTPIYINPNNINRISTHKPFNRPTEFTYIDMIGDSDVSYFEVKETVDEVLAMLSDPTDEMQYCEHDVDVAQFIQGWLSCKAEVIGLINKYFPNNGKPVSHVAIVDFIYPFQARRLRPLRLKMNCVSYLLDFPFRPWYNMFSRITKKG